MTSRLNAFGRLQPLRYQRGIALLVAIVIVALATIVAAAIAFDTGLAARRAAGGLALEQALAVTQGAEGLAAYAIVEARRGAGANTLHPAQDWARPIGPLEVAPGVILSAQVEDLQGRFNLNQLVDGNGAANAEAVKVFDRLLEHAGVPGTWGASMVDWIDPDTNPQPGGAEDPIYLSETPGYRTANRVVTSPSEMLALKGFGIENWRKIEPYVAALPRDAGMNLCGVPAFLLDALTAQQQFSASPAALATNRATRCFPADQATFTNMLQDPQQFAALQAQLGLGWTSNYFALRTLVTIGTSQFALYSLLQYDGAGGNARVRVVQRGFAD